MAHLLSVVDQRLTLGILGKKKKSDDILKYFLLFSQKIWFDFFFLQIVSLNAFYLPQIIH